MQVKDHQPDDTGKYEYENEKEGENSFLLILSKLHFSIANELQLVSAPSASLISKPDSATSNLPIEIPATGYSTLPSFKNGATEQTYNPITECSGSRESRAWANRR